mmetsp:Transcript_331/g.957  ORF Transcript_331/g.957 Transcript_331/m.957 type:complete len:525 (+) Transcript_331:274-1848(+)
MVPALKRALRHERIQRLADAVHNETNLTKLYGIHDVASVEDVGRLHHAVVQLLVVERLELVPLRHDGNAVRTRRSLVRRLACRELLFHHRHLRRNLASGVVPHVRIERKVADHLVLRHLRVVARNLRLVRHQLVAHVNCRRLARVPGVLLEGEPEDGASLAGHGVEHRLEHAVDEAVLLVVVDRDDAAPVVRHLLKSNGFADVHEVKDVLLEAASSESHGRVEELRSNAAVRSDRVADLLHVCSRRLAERGDGVDGRDALSEEGVRRELGQLGGPQVGRDDALRRHPPLVHSLERGNSLEARLRLPSADEHAVGLLEVVDGGTFGKELGVRQDVEPDGLIHAVPGEHLLNSLGRLDRDRGLLNDDLRRRARLGDGARGRLPVREISRGACTDAAHLGRCVDGDEDDVRLPDVLFHIDAEEEVAPARLEDNLVQSRFVDGQFVAVPLVDACLSDVEYNHLDVGALVRDHRHRRSTDVTGTYARDLHYYRDKNKMTMTTTTARDFTSRAEDEADGERGGVVKIARS